jgi:hypothetical protein
MDLVRRAFFTLAILAATAWAQSLSIQVGNTIAGQSYMTKMAQFVFRVNGCADLSKAQVKASAEGIVNDARRTMPLRIVPSQPAGVYAINPEWGRDGKWVVAISTTCANETAGAIVPVTGGGFVRESTQLLSHAPAASEIDAALAAFNAPGR